MNIRKLHQNFVNIRRFQEIATVLGKYGFTDLLDILGIDLAIGLAKKVGLINKEFALMSRAERMKLAAEELGPTFIKLGQILSTRDDLLGPSYIHELKKLQENVKSVEPHLITNALLENYEVEQVDEVFDNFSYRPMATASISQVHEAYLKDGSHVIVKIQRPNIRETIETDVGVLSYIVEIIQEQLGDPDDPANWSMVLEEFIENIVKELDFNREARLMVRFDAMFADNPKIKIPKVFQEYSSRHVLVQEFVDGVQLYRTDEMQKEGIDLDDLGKTLISSFFKQVFSEGVFHADPHPGNLRALSNGTLVFLDFGMVGQLDHDNMMQLTRIFWGAGKGDYELVARSFNKLCRGTVLGVSDQMVMEMRDLIIAFQSLSVVQMRVDNILPAVDEILRRYQLRLPTHLSLLFKALISLESVVKELSSDLNLMDFLLPQVHEMIQARLEVGTLTNQITDRGLLMYDYLAEVPKDLFVILKNIQRLQFEASVRHKRMGEHLVNLEKIFNRAILGLLISGLLIGSSFLLALNRNNDGLIYFLGLSGYILAGIFAVVIIYSIVTVQPRSRD